jgi:hypothetical protein
MASVAPVRERPYGGKGPAARKSERRERLVGRGARVDRDGGGDE